MRHMVADSCCRAAGSHTGYTVADSIADHSLPGRIVADCYRGLLVAGVEYTHRCTVLTLDTAPAGLGPALDSSRYYSSLLENRCVNPRE